MVYSSTLMLEAVRFSRKLVNIQELRGVTSQKLVLFSCLEISFRGCKLVTSGIIVLPRGYDFTDEARHE
jgi:hypothetical protein